jgi:hypothetical protein
MKQYSNMLYLTLDIFVAFIIVYIMAKLILWVLYFRWLLDRNVTSFEITPPITESKSAEANRELMNILHGFRTARTFKDKFLKRETSIVLQITSSKADGIRYVVEIDRRMASSLFQSISSYLPGVKVTEIKVTTPSTNYEVMEFKQTGHFAFPLASAEVLERNDPVSYITGMMTKLKASEQVTYQLIATPLHLNEAKSIGRRILRNEDLLLQLNTKNIPFMATFFNVLNKILFTATDIIGEIYHGSYNSGSNISSRSDYERMQIAARKKPSRTISAFELQLMESIHNKVNQPMFRVALRVGVLAEDVNTSRTKLSAIRTALQGYNVPSYQSLSAKMNLPLLGKIRTKSFMYHLPNMLRRNGLILSSSEIASLYHFPLGGNTKIDNLSTSLSRTLAAPIALKQNNKLDIVLGQNKHNGLQTAIGLSEKERERHIYIIGGTGNGKTTMLQYAIVQDMQAGKGLAIVDPHGDMAETMLKYVPQERVNDVVYFNPDDIGYPIGLNLLELPEGLDGDDLLREKDLITESVISVFRKIFSEEDTGGHRIEYVLRNTIQTALTIDDATLFTVFDLLNDPDYRKKVVKTLDNKDLKNFWKNELGKAGDMQKVKMAAGITAKIGRFLFSASAKRILEQPKSTIDFDDIINSGKILICNLSKGLIGEDTSELFGITILAKLQLASLRRARISQRERKPFYLYVDEFQNFATQSFVQMLSESRKYKLFMTMAEQSTSQQKDQQMIDIILANVGTIICFRTGNPQDEKLLLPLFSPYIKKGEISNLSSFNFFAKLAAVNVQEPMSGVTLLLTKTTDNTIAANVITNSRATFSKKFEVSDRVKPINERFYELKPKKSDKGLKHAKNGRVLDSL